MQIIERGWAILEPPPRYVARVPAGLSLWIVWDVMTNAAVEGLSSSSERQVQCWARHMSDAYRREMCAMTV